MKYTGFKDCENNPLFDGDNIKFHYSDKHEENGTGTVIGKICFENGTFVVKEISFAGYDWNSSENRPSLLFDWLNDNKCYKVVDITALNDNITGFWVVDMFGHIEVSRKPLKSQISKTVSLQLRHVFIAQMFMDFKSSFLYCQNAAKEYNLSFIPEISGGKKSPGFLKKLFNLNK